MQISTGIPVFYRGGVQGASSVVGFESGQNRVARYAFDIPQGSFISGISGSLGQIFPGAGDSSAPVRYKINQDPESYANAGSGFAYDESVSLSFNGGRWYASFSGAGTLTGGTYYLWIFPGNSDFGYWGWNSGAADLSLAEVPRYYIYFNGDGGTGVPATQTKYHGQTTTLSSVQPTKQGYIFSGWAYAPGGSVKYMPGAAYSEDRDRTLYAVWEPMSYSVTYSANGGSDAPSAQTKYHGIDLTLSEQIPIRENHRFLGWAMSADGPAVYQPGYVYSDNAALSLFAVWEITAVYRWRAKEISSHANVSDNAVKALWSGYVGGREVLCAACNGFLWELSETDGVWAKTSCGLLDTSGKVCLFGFGGKLWAMSETEYKAWNGTTLAPVAGYVPLIMVSCLADGTGEELEGINRLTGKRRIRVSPNGTATVYKLPEKAQTVLSIKTLADGAEMTGWTYNADVREINFGSAPASGTNSVEVTYDTGESGGSIIKGMKLAEIYHSQQGPCVFLAGDGTNRAIYSGLDENGNPRADYFPVFNEALIGDANTPINDLLRHGTKLLCFKQDSAYTIGSYNSITLDNGRIIGAFRVKPLNRSIGCCSHGAAVLVENTPVTPDGKSLVSWRMSEYYDTDEKSAEPISARVADTLGLFDFKKLGAFFDKREREYYLYDGSGRALVYGVSPNAWTLYTNFPAVCMASYKDELFYGTADGRLVHMSDAYLTDDGAPIPAKWESGALTFSQAYERKYSAMLWLALKPEDEGYIDVTAKTDVKDEFASYPADAPMTGELPHVVRLKLKAKKFTFYKLILTNDKPGKTATVVSASVRVRGTGYAR